MALKSPNTDDCDHEDSTGGVGGTSILSSANSNNSITPDDSFNPYRAKSPFDSVSSFTSLTSSIDSETRKLNLHLLQGNLDRSWIDPWEMTPSAKLYQKNYESPTRHLVASSILPNAHITPSSNYSINTRSTIDAIEENRLQSPLLLDENELDSAETLNLRQKQMDKSQSSKFGPWDGVMTGALLNIWGVILFLRFGWIICQSGIIESILIVLLSTVVTTLTTISMSAICTNGTVKAGGAYYIISRTIGPEWGGSVGMILSIGSMIATSLYLIGFAESLATNLYAEAGFHVFAETINDIRMWATVFLLIVLILAIVGLKYVIKAQILLLIWIVFSIISLMIGSFYRTSSNPEINGIEGFKQNFNHNLWAQYTDGYTFWTVLAIFFPAVTGIMAGANLSGDLRDPSKDIPKGTFVAIFVSSTVYIILVFLIGSTAPRESLCQNPLILTNIAINDYIIYIATYAATISSAIASLVGAPRILMAVGKDKIMHIPYLNFFTKANAGGNPIRGYYLTAFVALCVNAIGSIDLIAPLISLFFIMVYLLINFSCFIMEISRSPGWRPGFKYFSAWTAIAGALLCAVVMFLLDPIYALCTVTIALFFYIYVSINDPDVNWGSAFHSRAIYKTYRALLQLALSNEKKSEINWRPSFLVIAFGRKYSLTKYVETLRKCHSLIFSCSIYKENYRQNVIRKLDEKNALSRGGSVERNSSFVRLRDGYLPIRKFSHKRMKYGGKRSLGFSDTIVTDSSYRNCMQNVLQNSGLGALRPNTLILNLLRLNEEEDDAYDDDEKECDEYIEILRDALLYGYGVMLCCGLCDVEHYHKIDWSLRHSFENIIDVWWIADDGGLILLIPYIMCLCHYWNKCKVRINLIKDKHDIDKYKPKELNKIESLINKFRLNKIYHTKPRIIYVENHNPSKRTINRFEKVSKTNIKNAKRQNVIRRWLKLSELLNEYSKQSIINVVTLPVPTSHIKPAQYVAILHLLSDQNTLPPTIIMRGNGEQTLTFYSE